MERVKIILDADVLIHFSKAGKLSLLPTIFPEYDHTVLCTVYEETISIRTQIDNQMKFLKNMVLLPFEPTGQMRLEYAKLRTKYGKGESACYRHNSVFSQHTNMMAGLVVPVTFL